MTTTALPRPTDLSLDDQITHWVCACQHDEGAVGSLPIIAWCGTRLWRRNPRPSESVSCPMCADARACREPCPVCGRVR